MIFRKIFYLASAFVGMFFGGCTANVDIAALSNCTQSGEAYFRHIPLASRSEHQQALRFAPSNPDNCLLYVVQHAFSPTGGSRATIFLAPAEFKRPPFPMRYEELISLFADHIAEITDNMYAMWELSQGSYMLEGYSGTDFRASPIPIDTETPSDKLVVHVPFECRSGDVIFFRTTSHFTDDFSLKELEKETGEKYIRKSVRSIGCADWAHRLIYKECPVNK
jgi:hypothetical protein